MEILIHNSFPQTPVGRCALNQFDTLHSLFFCMCFQLLNEIPPTSHEDLLCGDRVATAVDKAFISPADISDACATKAILLLE